MAEGRPPWYSSAVDKAIEARVERIVKGGYGLCRTAAGVLLAPMAAPGDLLRGVPAALPGGGPRGLPEAELVEPSPLRVEAPCPLYGDCGGCDFQHLSYAAQLAAKEGILLDCLARIGGVEGPPLAPPIASPAEWGARSRFVFSSDAAGRPSLKRRSSAETVPVPACPVAHPAFSPFLARGAGAMPPASRLTAFGSDSGLFVGDEEARAEVLGREFRFKASGFFQSNLGALGRFIEEEILPLRGGRAVDLFCGAGLFSAFLGDKFDEVMGYESDRAAILAARANAPRARFSARDLAADPPALAGADLVLADPPRTGLPAKLRAALAALPRQGRAPALLYLSCDPATFARDAAALVAGGYSLARARAIDFYPQTSHLECAGFFEAPR